MQLTASVRTFLTQATQHAECKYRSAVSLRCVALLYSQLVLTVSSTVCKTQLVKAQTCL